MGSPTQDHPSSLSRQLAVRLLAFDVVIVLPLTSIWLSLIDARLSAAIVALCAAMLLVRCIGVLAHLWWLLRPVEVWLARADACSDAELLAAAEALRGFTRQHALVYALGWVFYVGVGSWLGGVLLANEIIIGRDEIIVLGFLLVPILVASPTITTPLASYYATPLRLRLAGLLERRGLSIRRVATPMIHSLGAQVGAMVLTPLGLFASLTWDTEVHSARAQAITQLEQQLVIHAQAIAGGQATPDPSERLVDAAQVPESLRHAARHDVRTATVYAAVPLSDGRWLVGQRRLDSVGREVWPRLLPSIIGVLMWASFAITMLARSISAPIERMRALIHRIVEVGDLAEIGKLPVLEDDELGELSHDLNHLLANLRQLAHSSRMLADGRLDVAVDGHGELSDAFRSMTAQLHAIVHEIRRMALDLATTARQILAAAREQELAGEQQAASMHDLAESMAALARSAAQVSAAVHDVQANAEQTVRTTDEMAAALAELDARSRGVAELLDLIREIASRSDLLALNGSLEATRAGQAGRGFALVAAEMRRLAERVSGTVADVGGLVEGITTASANTTRATGKSRSLAEDTNVAARQIAGETARQSSETTHASEAVRELASLVHHSSVATTQTRAAAEMLEHQAQLLRRMIDHFEG